MEHTVKPEVVYPSSMQIEDGHGRVTELPKDTIMALTHIALRGGLSYEGALAQAIVNENFLDREQARGAQLLVERKGEIRYIVRKPVIE